LPSVKNAQWDKLAKRISKNSEEHEDLDQVLAWIEQRKKDSTALYRNLETESEFGEIVSGLGTQHFSVSYTSRDGDVIVATHSPDEFLGDDLQTMESSSDGAQDMDMFRACVPRLMKSGIRLSCI